MWRDGGGICNGDVELSMNTAEKVTSCVLHKSNQVIGSTSVLVLPTSK